ncbi:MAG: CRISPR-associated endonuclease Cas1 [Chlorobi bacterium]|nr:CRISPR-associated endonuclease Cas1 [Chlorobiota bacterium]
MIDKQLLYVAWQQIRSKKSGGGIDKISVEEFEKNVDKNINRIHLKLNNHTYLPEAYLEISIPKDENEKRTLGLATINDKIVQVAIKLIIESRLETGFFKTSYAYRPRKGAVKAIKKVQKYIQNGNIWLAKCDIDKYFDNINHERLKRQLKPYIKNNYLLELIFMFIKMGYVKADNNWQERHKGVPQGAVLSPLLSNLYLTPLDQRMNDKNVAYVRYADDFVIFAKKEEKAQNILNETVAYIQKKLLLQLNEGSYVKHTQYGFKFLGVWINQNNLTLPEAKINKIKKKLKNKFQHDTYPDKYFEEIQGIRNYYAKIVPQHILYPIDEYIIELWKNKLSKISELKTKKQIKEATKDLTFITRLYNANVNSHRKEIVNFVYEIKHQKKIETAEQAVKMRRKIYEEKAVENTHLQIAGFGKSIGVSKNLISIKEKGKIIQKLSTTNLRHISISAKGVSVSTAFIRFCTKNNIVVDFIDKKGKPYAKIHRFDSLHPQLWLKQIEYATQPKGKEIARKIVLAKINNQIKLIKYFSKYAKKTEKDIAKELPAILKTLEQIKEKAKKSSKENTDNYKAYLMGLEGAASARYWQWVELMIDEETDFSGRHTKDAQDLVNQMLNYGYAILYRLVWNSIIKHGLHYEISFFHAYRKNKGTLIFDLIEPFRQPVVDRAIISLINKKTKLENPDNILSKPTIEKLVDAVYKRLTAFDKYKKERNRLIDIIDKQTEDLKSYLLGKEKKFTAYKTTKW